MSADAATGKRTWRFHAVPGAGEKGAETWSGDSCKIGGGGTWGVRSYDPELDLLYWGVGQPYPDYDGDAREGDNLYTDSVVTLDPADGALRWHFQHTPHDMWDWDGINELVFAEVEHNGAPVKASLHADRNGHFYAIDWTTGGPSSTRRLAFVPAIENCAVFTNYGVKAKAAGLEPGPSGFRYFAGKAYGKIMATDAHTGKTAWEVKMRTPAGGGVLSTAGGLVFTGDAEGNLLAFDADTGEKLWAYQTGAGIRAAPVTCRLDCVQCVAIASGMGCAVNGYTGRGVPWKTNHRSGSALFVFRLFEAGASRRFHGGAKAAADLP